MVQIDGARATPSICELCGVGTARAGSHFSMCLVRWEGFCAGVQRRWNLGYSYFCSSCNWVQCSKLGSGYGPGIVDTERHAVTTDSPVCDGRLRQPCKDLDLQVSQEHLKLCLMNSAEANAYVEEAVLDGHTDWVRDVAWSPNIGLPRSYVATASQDKTVLIWTKEGQSAWQKRQLQSEKFPDVVWRVSWSLSGNVLAVSGGDNKVTLWRENLAGGWENAGTIEE